MHAAFDQRHPQLAQAFDRAAAGRIDCRDDMKKLHGPDRIGMQQEGMARATAERAAPRRAVLAGGAPCHKA
jgi:hypothetical protein